MPPRRPLSALARLTRGAARVPADVVAWPWRAGRELWWVRSQLPALRAAASEAVRLSIEADGYDGDIAHIYVDGEPEQLGPPDLPGGIDYDRWVGIVRPR